VSTAPGAVPRLRFAVEEAGVLEHAAAPTLRFLLRVESVGGEAIRSVQLNAMIRIAAARRGYAPAEQERLLDLFGEPPRWGTTLKSLFWTQSNLTVPAFEGSSLVEVPVACTYDFEVASAKYFHALREGVVPLEILFSGTFFYSGPDGALRTGRISWEEEADFALPVEVWRAAMERYFPGSAWLRLRSDAFERLYRYRARNALPSWEHALEALLGAAGEEA